MRVDEARVGARVTWAVDDPGSPHHSGTITAVNGAWAAVQWDTPTAHHIADLRLLPDEALP